MKIDYDLYYECLKQALKVEFLATKKELNMYISSLYFAAVWGRNETIKYEEYRNGIMT